MNLITTLEEAALQLGPNQVWYCMSLEKADIEAPGILTVYLATGPTCSARIDGNRVIISDATWLTSEEIQLESPYINGTTDLLYPRDFPLQQIEKEGVKQSLSWKTSAYREIPNGLYIGNAGYPFVFSPNKGLTVGALGKSHDDLGGGLVRGRLSNAKTMVVFWDPSSIVGFRRSQNAQNCLWDLIKEGHVSKDCQVAIEHEVMSISQAMGLEPVDSSLDVLSWKIVEQSPNAPKRAINNAPEDWEIIAVAKTFDDLKRLIAPNQIWMSPRENRYYQNWYYHTGVEQPVESTREDMRVMKLPAGLMSKEYHAPWAFKGGGEGYKDINDRSLPLYLIQKKEQKLSWKTVDQGIQEGAIVNTWEEFISLIGPDQLWKEQPPFSSSLCYIATGNNPYRSTQDRLWGVEWLTEVGLYNHKNDLNDTVGEASIRFPLTYLGPYSTHGSQKTSKLGDIDFQYYEHPSEVSKLLQDSLRGGGMLAANHFEDIFDNADPNYVAHMILAVDTKVNEIAGVMTWYVSEKETQETGIGQVSGDHVFVRPDYRKQQLGTVLQEAFISHLNAKYGMDKYVIDSSVASAGGRKLLDLRKILMFAPENQKEEPMLRMDPRELLSWKHVEEESQQVNTIDEFLANAKPGQVWRQVVIEGQVKPYLHIFNTLEGGIRLSGSSYILPKNSVSWGWSAEEAVEPGNYGIHSESFPLILVKDGKETLSWKTVEQGPVVEYAYSFEELLQYIGPNQVWKGKEDGGYTYLVCGNTSPDIHLGKKKGTANIINVHWANNPVMRTNRSFATVLSTDGPFIYKGPLGSKTSSLNNLSWKNVDETSKDILSFDDISQMIPHAEYVTSDNIRIRTFFHPSVMPGEIEGRRTINDVGTPNGAFRSLYISKEDFPFTFIRKLEESERLTSLKLSSADIEYPTVEDIIECHDDILKEYGGKAGTFPETISKLEAALGRMQSGAFDQEFYPSLVEKAAVLMHSIVTTHPFPDVNKRTAFLAGVEFLHHNGLTVPDSDSIADTILAVANDQAGYEHLLEHVKASAKSLTDHHDDTLQRLSWKHVEEESANYFEVLTRVTVYAAQKGLYPVRGAVSVCIYKDEFEKDVRVRVLAEMPPSSTTDPQYESKITFYVSMAKEHNGLFFAEEDYHVDGITTKEEVFALVQQYCDKAFPTSQSFPVIASLPSLSWKTVVKPTKVEVGGGKHLILETINNAPNGIATNKRIVRLGLPWQYFSQLQPEYVEWVSKGLYRLTDKGKYLLRDLDAAEQREAEQDMQINSSKLSWKNVDISNVPGLLEGEEIVDTAKTFEELVQKMQPYQVWLSSETYWGGTTPRLVMGFNPLPATEEELRKRMENHVHDYTVDYGLKNAVWVMKETVSVDEDRIIGIRKERFPMYLLQTKEPKLSWKHVEEGLTPGTVINSLEELKQVAAPDQVWQRRAFSLSSAYGWFILGKNFDFDIDMNVITNADWMCLTEINANVSVRDNGKVNIGDIHFPITYLGQYPNVTLKSESSKLSWKTVDETPTTLHSLHELLNVAQVGQVWLSSKRDSYNYPFLVITSLPLNINFENAMVGARWYDRQGNPPKFDGNGTGMFFDQFPLTLVSSNYEEWHQQLSGQGQEKLSFIKMSTLFPTRNQILKLYNKYAKGYEYTKEAWEVREKTLYAAKTLYQATKDIRDFGRKTEKKDPDGNLVVERIDKMDRPSNISGAVSLYELRPAIEKLENANTDFSILVAIDHIFNIMHDMGPILTNLIHQNFNTWQGDEEWDTFKQTLDEIRDWGTKSDPRKKLSWKTVEEPLAHDYTELSKQLMPYQVWKSKAPSAHPHFLIIGNNPKLEISQGTTPYIRNAQTRGDLPKKEFPEVKTIAVVTPTMFPLELISQKEASKLSWKTVDQSSGEVHTIEELVAQMKSGQVWHATDEGQPEEKLYLHILGDAWFGKKYPVSRGALLFGAAWSGYAYRVDNTESKAMIDQDDFPLELLNENDTTKLSWKTVEVMPEPLFQYYASVTIPLEEYNNAVRSVSLQQIVTREKIKLRHLAMRASEDIDASTIMISKFDPFIEKDEQNNIVFLHFVITGPYEYMGKIAQHLDNNGFSSELAPAS